MGALKIIGYILAGLVALYGAAAVGATFWPETIFTNSVMVTPDVFAARQRASGVLTEQTYPYAERRFAARDGAQLYSRLFGAPASTTVVLVHGVTADSSQMNVPAGLLQVATGAQVIALDLRGHGHSSGTPWQTAYAGQYEDDVADVIKALRLVQPHGKVILAGHSMGGGIALRYALDAQAPPVDGYLLLAPLFGTGSPTERTDAPAGPRSASAAYVYFRTPRLIGVLLFNLIGVHAFNNLPILYFNQPGSPEYGYTALESMQPNAPRGYRVALGAIKVPMLLIAGSRDEAFNAAAYSEVLNASGHPGSTLIIEGTTHNRVLSDPRTIAAIAKWMSTLL
jgi:alpha-beta hydrolase superfamily lysophospholipase